MRLFIGIRLNEKSNYYYKNLATIIETHCQKGKFYNLKNYHLTIEFIGTVEDDKLLKLRLSCQNVVKRFDSFKVATGNLRSFDKKNKKILWFDLEKGKEKIQELHKELSKELNLMGIEASKELVPHLTIARGVILESESVDDISDKLEYNNYESIIEELIIFESKRIDDVLRYIPIETFKFEEVD